MPIEINYQHEAISLIVQAMREGNESLLDEVREVVNGWMLDRLEASALHELLDVASEVIYGELS